MPPIASALIGRLKLPIRTIGTGVVWAYSSISTSTRRKWRVFFLLGLPNSLIRRGSISQNLLARHNNTLCSSTYRSFDRLTQPASSEAGYGSARAAPMFRESGTYVKFTHAGSELFA